MFDFEDRVMVKFPIKHSDFIDEYIGIYAYLDLDLQIIEINHVK